MSSPKHSKLSPTTLEESYVGVMQALLTNPILGEQFIHSTRSGLLDGNDLSAFLTFCDMLDKHFQTGKVARYQKIEQVFSFYNAKDFFVRQISHENLDTEGLLFIFDKYPYLKPRAHDTVNWFDLVRQSKLENKEQLLQITWLEQEEKEHSFFKKLKSLYEHLIEKKEVGTELLNECAKAQEQWKEWRQKNTSLSNYENSKELYHKFEALNAVITDTIFFFKPPQTFQIRSALGLEPQYYFDRITNLHYDNLILAVRQTLQKTDLCAYLNIRPLHEGFEVKRELINRLSSLQHKKKTEKRLEKAQLYNEYTRLSSGLDIFFSFMDTKEQLSQITPSPLAVNTKLTEAVLYLYYGLEFTFDDINSFFELFEDNFKLVCSQKDKDNQNINYRPIDCFFQEIVPRVDYDKLMPPRRPAERMGELLAQYQKNMLEENLSLNSTSIKSSFKI